MPLDAMHIGLPPELTYSEYHIPKCSLQLDPSTTLSGAATSNTVHMPCCNGCCPDLKLGRDRSLAPYHEPSYTSWYARTLCLGVSRLQKLRRIRNGIAVPWLDKLTSDVWIRKGKSSQDLIRLNTTPSTICKSCDTILRSLDFSKEKASFQKAP